MKKIILIISIIMVVMVSCKKEEVVTQVNSNSNYPEGGGTAPYTTWQGPEHGCMGPATNCGPVVVIVGHKIRGASIAYSNFQNAIIAGPNAIQHFFTYDSWNLLFPNLTSTQLAELQSGSYSVIKYEKSDNSTVDCYYLFGPSNTLTLNNVEFVLRTNFIE